MDDGRVGVRESLESFGKAGVYYLSAMLVGALLSFGVLAASLIPFQPYTFYEYGVLPVDACPNQTLNVTALSELEDSPLYTLESATVEGQWTKLSEEGEPSSTFGNMTVTLPELEAYEKRKGPSPLLRTAPDTGGRYSLEATVTVEGRMLGIFKREQVEFVGDDKMDIIVDEGNC